MKITSNRTSSSPVKINPWNNFTLTIQNNRGKRYALLETKDEHNMKVDYTKNPNKKQKLFESFFSPLITIY